MAINQTGAGGVAAGTVYTVGFSAGEWHAARYSPDGVFELAWTKVNRCGPKTAPPTTCPAYATGSSGGVDIAVDQTTGNVYVFYLFETPKAIRIYKADGTGPISQFGELDANGTVTSSPGKLHGSPANENIAVDDAGTVYVTDEDVATDQFHRLMVFRPETPGDYEHYVYAGQAKDIGSGFLPTHPPYRPVVDDAGDVYVAGETYIEKYDPAQPAIPICTFSLTTGGITSMTVNPATGAPYYYSFKVADRKIHQLSPCNGEGKFVEKDSGGNYVMGPPFSPVPQRANIEGMAFNPTKEFSPGRPLGVLYAGTPEPCPPVGSCPPAAEGQSSLGYMFATQISLKPVVVSQSASKVGTTSAILNAQVNPKGSQTTYIFQYLTEAAYQENEPADRFAGATEVPIGEAVLGNGQQPLLASVTIAGLAVGTTYRYRVVATNAEGSVEGSDEAFTTFPAEVQGLPDGRAYELVSPAQKNGGEVLPAAPNTASCGNECKPGLAAKRFPAQVAPSGNAIGYQGSPFLLNQGASEYDEYVSTRTESGWQTSSLSPPLAGDSGGAGFEAFGFDTNLGRSVVSADNPALVPSAPLEYENLFSQSTANRLDLDPLLETTPPNRPASGSDSFKLEYVGASADHSRIFFEANDALTEATGSAPAAVDGGPTKLNLYEWSGGQLHLVNVQPLNAETIPGAAFGSGFQLATLPPTAADFSHAISADGSRVFWSSEGGQVYVREDGEETREIPDHTGKFLSASTDGSKVLLSDGVLYDLETNTPADLTGGSGGFQGMVGQSDDLSSVYFVATSVLTATPNDQGDVAEPGANNLYAWHEGSIAFVGALLTSDNVIGLGIWRAAPVRRAAEASPNGRWLAFNSKAALTGANTIGACEFDPSVGKYVGSVPCEEAYLYDSETGSLICASCNPTGAPPLGGTFLRLMTLAPGFLSQPHFLTDEGRLFFDSRDALSSLDTNNGVEDVYQYEPTGVGSCTKAGGCVSLISSGRGSYDSNLLTADPSGANVFFTTRQRLVPRDQDALIDLYDARVGGGIAAEREVPPSECVGEGCQPPGPVPSQPLPSSSSFEGSGNATPKKPAKKKKKHKKKHTKNGGKHKQKAAKHRGGSR
ncbi:MAG TPA: hypothetical protein VFJ57_07325 [Solirubrobacterales bacterium]|nr:hypothetical protein [Solirubrobacterales bacterium]